MPAGRPPRFSYEDVAQGCAELDARGMLSANNLLTHLGGGSKLTLLRHYNRWLDERRAATVRPVDELLSESLRAALVRELDITRTAAQADLKKQLAAVQEQLTTALAGLESAEEDNATREEAMTAAAAAAAARETTLKQALAEAHGRAEALTAQVATLEQKFARELEGAERARVEAAKALNRLEIAEDARQHLESHNTQLLADLKAAHTAAHAADKQAAVAQEKANGLAQQLEGAQREIEASKQARVELQTALADAEKRAGEAERSLAVCANESKSLTARLDAEAKARAASDASLANTQALLTASERAVAEGRKQLDDVRRETAETKHQADQAAAEAKRQAAESNKQLGAAQQRIESLEKLVGSAKRT